MTTEGLNRIAFSIAYKHSPKKLRQLLDHYGSATEALQHAPHTITSEVMRQAEKEAAFIAQHQIQTYFYQDTNYPTRLSHCVDAPILLYSKGQLDVKPKHAISIVGTRTPSELGKDWCRKLVLDLASHIPNLTVIEITDKKILGIL